MKKNILPVCLFVIFIGFALVFSGCGVPGKVTGGGYIPSVACYDYENCDECNLKANFGFNANSCDDNWEVSGHFNYVDMDAKDGGVKMNGIVVEVAECERFDSNDDSDLNFACGICKDELNGGNEAENFYAAKVKYRSTNPKDRGEGYAVACVSDNGEGFNAESADIAAFYVLTGPFQGYMNAGRVQGNIQAHECEE